MSVNWSLKKISDICEFQNNKRVPLKSLDREKRQGEYPYYGASGIVDYIDNYIFDGKFLLISEDGENLRTRNTPIAFQAQGRFWVNNHAHILAEKEEGILDYLEYYFSILNINPYITGAVQPKLNKANLDAIEIPIPPVNERLLINQILNSLKEKILLNNQINQTLESIAQALFKSWFIDFEPVRAKIAAKQEGKDPELAAMCAISGKTQAELEQMAGEDFAELQAMAALFPDELIESELGEVPKGWEVSNFKGFCKKIESGGTPKRSELHYWNGEIRWLSSGEVRETVVLDTKEKITKTGLLNSSAKLWEKYTTVIAMYGATAGQVCLLANEMAANQACCGLIPKDEFKSFAFLIARNSVRSLSDKASGSAQQNLNKGIIENQPCVLPRLSVARNFENLVFPLLRKWLANSEENIRLSVIRDSLLPKLLSGEVSLDMV